MGQTHRPPGSQQTVNGQSTGQVPKGPQVAEGTATEESGEKRDRTSDAIL